MKEFLLEYIYSVEDYICAGGFVMIPLSLISIIMWSLIVERIHFLKELYKESLSKEDLIRCIKNKEISESKGIAGLFIKEFLKRKTGKKKLDMFVVDEVTFIISSSLDRYVSIIKILAVISPLLGLLGTVTGMIKVFNVISIFGTGDAKLIANGISEALITTQTGLIIAIPGIYASRFLQRRFENLKNRMILISMYVKRHI